MSQKKQNSATNGKFAWSFNDCIMNTRTSIFLIILSAIAFGCTQAQNKANLAPKEFAAKLGQSADATLLDVRTSEEFASGHIDKARNIDWNGDNFEQQIAQLDKAKPIFVYCLRGSRSASAADKMRSIGFKEVYELDGGIAKWQSAKLPVTNN